MDKIKVIIIYCCLVWLFGCSSQSSQVNLVSGTVTKVNSGQTIEVVLTKSSQALSFHGKVPMTETSKVAKIRITGIDAPDLRQSPWGKKAQQRLTELVMGLPIQLAIETSHDRYQRLNAHIWQDKTLVSQQLVTEGCVLANTSYHHDYSKLLIDAQEYARLMGYGIWNPQEAMRHTPGQFRSTIKDKN
ncbi:MAG: thermonuclease family protein [Waterburya sp.]